METVLYIQFLPYIITYHLIYGDLEDGLSLFYPHCALSPCTFGQKWPEFSASSQRHAGTKPNQVAHPLEALEASIDKLDMEQLGQKAMGQPCNK